MEHTVNAAEVDARTLALVAIERYGAQQKHAELSSLVEFLRERRLHHVLEIGSWTGGTLWLWRKLATGQVVSVDINPDIPTEHIEGHVHCITGDSRELATLQRVPPIRYDLIHIDGDHSEAGVRRDWELYRPLLARDGVVVIHDIVWHPENSGIHVEPFWTDLKRRERTIEFVDPHRCAFSRQVKDDAGIGVVLCP